MKFVRSFVRSFGGRAIGGDGGDVAGPTSVRLGSRRVRRASGVENIASDAPSSRPSSSSASALGTSRRGSTARAARTPSCRRARGKFSDASTARAAAASASGLGSSSRTRPRAGSSPCPSSRARTTLRTAAAPPVVVARPAICATRRREIYWNGPFARRAGGRRMFSPSLPGVHCTRVVAGSLYDDKLGLSV